MTTHEKLNLLVIASSEGVRSALYQQLQSIPHIAFDGILLELSDAALKCAETKPAVIIIELTGRELDAGLFIQTILSDVDYQPIILALHHEFNTEIMAEAVQKGVMDFIQYPAHAKRLAEVLDSLYQERFRNQEEEATSQNKPDGKSDSSAPQTGSILAVFGSKGGSGATTIAMNLAFELSQRPGHDPQHDVVLFDLDQMFNNIAGLLKLSPVYVLGDIIGMNPSEVDDLVLQKMTVSHPAGFDVLVSCKSVLDDNGMLPPGLLERVVAYLRTKYRYVVIDLPSHILDSYHQYIVEACDHLLVVSGMDIPGLTRTKQYLDLVKAYFKDEKIKLLLNRWTLSSAYGMSHEELEEILNHQTVYRLPNDWNLAVQAHSLGEPLAHVDPKAALTRAIRHMALSFAGQETDNTPDSPQMSLVGGWVRRLLRQG